MMILDLLKSAFALTDEEKKVDALDDIYQRVVWDGLDLEPAVGALLDSLSSEASQGVRSRVWMLVTQSPQDARLVQLSKDTLLDRKAENRGSAAIYLSRFQPDLQPWIVTNHLEDPDPEVSYYAAVVLLKQDPARAVRVWLRLLDQGVPHGLGEVIVESIAEHGDPDISRELMDRDRQQGGGTLWGSLAARIDNWYALEYLDRPQARQDQALGGYRANCPNCGWTHSVREGHTGERARCRRCGHEFRIPPPPSVGA